MLWLGAPERWLAGDALLSGAVRSAVLLAYVGTVYVLVLFAGGFDYAHREPPWWLHLIALLVVAATVWPVQGWLRHSIDRLVYDWHDDPYAVLSELGQHLDPAQAQNVREIVPTIASTIAATLRLPYVAISSSLDGEPVTATHGRPPPGAELLAIPLAYRGAPIGTLHAAPRRPGEALSARDVRLLQDLARQVGIALHAAQLGESLQAARERLVTAREEERRRIRRDLHDGLAPTLASLRMQLGALRRQLREDPDAAEVLVDELRAEVRSATADIRRLVYDLRPPLLDEHGLAGALRALGRVLEPEVLSLELPAELPPLAAAVEVAAYRIASEAVHNVARYAQATHCTLRLALEAGTLVLDVADDGVGLPAEATAGVGLASMRERAAELGGTLSITTGPAGGTRVTASLPVGGPVP
jgi:signal transduction histidine kinase